jgi:hypothetical protein
MATTILNQPAVPSELSSNTRSIRLYSIDDKALIELHRIAKTLNRKMDIVDLIRDCVQAGLPVVQKRWEPLTRK